MTPEDERLKADRLAALIAAGYRERDWNSTDADLVRLAQRLDGGNVLDHPRLFRQDDDRIIVFHTYYHGDDLEARVRAIASGVTDRWGREIRVAIGEHLNIYYPSYGHGYELRRYHRVRAKRWCYA